MGQPDTRPRQPLCLLWAIPYLLCAAFSHRASPLALACTC